MNSPLEIRRAIANRFMLIRPTFKMRNQEYHNYYGQRTQPEEIALRFFYGFHDNFPSVEDILRGDTDKEIEAVWHDAASAEYYYRNEKDWGFDE